MPYLNNLKLNSNNYAIGTKINKLNLNGTIYTLGLDTTDATANNNTIVSPYTAYVNGEKITGSIVSYGNQTEPLSYIHNNDQLTDDYSEYGTYYRIPKGCYMTPAISNYPEIFVPYNKSDFFPSEIAGVAIFDGGATEYEWCDSRVFMVMERHI